MSDYVQKARRATVGVSALGWIALLCLVGSIAFWLSLFIDLLAPPQFFSPQMVQAFLAVMAFSLVLPLFWSMLLPSSPAGKLLQKQQWATPGVITPTAIAAQQDNYAPTGHTNTVIFRLTATGAQTITGLSGAGDGRLVIIQNDDATDTITLNHESASSIAVDRFRNSAAANLALAPGFTATYIWVGSTTSRWVQQ